MSLPNFTPEERLIAQQKAQESRDAKKVFAEENLKLDWQDENFWRTSAASLGVRLPQKYDVGSKGVKKIAKKLGVDVNDFLSTTGCSTLKDLVELNPTFPSFALCGLVIEYHLEQKK